MAEQDPIAAMNNAKAKEEAETEGRTRNFTEAFDADDRQGVLGPNPDKRRAGPGQGIRADFAQETGGQAQTSVFDGKGNESVVMFGVNAEGQPVQGTGPDAASAEAEVAEGDAHDPGSDFGNLDKD
ncbi:MAG: hypothetical protein WKF86_06065 [Acidimicrobiales bacterium]